MQRNRFTGATSSNAGVWLHNFHHHFLHRKNREANGYDEAAKKSDDEEFPNWRRCQKNVIHTHLAVLCFALSLLTFHKEENSQPLR